MRIAKNHPRFHFDPNRGHGIVPDVAEIGRWCVERLTGPEGRDARTSIAEASRGLHRAGDPAAQAVASTTAAAIRAAARELHDIAREFGCDPTRLGSTREACANICLTRVAISAASLGASSAAGRVVEAVALLEAVVGRLTRTVRITCEAQAFTALCHSMIERGRFDGQLVAMVRDEVSPETAAMVDAMWGGAGSEAPEWKMPPRT